MGGAVSVVVPVYRARPYLVAAVESALAQPEVAEVLLVDDGSDDGSGALCRELARADRRVRAVAHPGGGHHGAGAARNRGVEEARSACVAFLDADDWYLPGRFAVGVPLLEASPSVDGVYEAAGVAFEDEDARQAWQAEGGRALLAVRRGVSPEDLLGVLVDGREGTIFTGAVLVRREAVLDVGGFDPSLPLGQDTALWWRLAAARRLVGGELERPVAIYRRHSGNRSSLGCPGHDRAPLAVAESTWAWSIRTGRGAGQQALLRRAVLDRALSAPPGRRLALGARLATTARILSRHPRLAAEPYLWRRLLAALTPR